jgi:RHS repeat-associated protein
MLAKPHGMCGCRCFICRTKDIESFGSAKPIEGSDYSVGKRVRYDLRFPGQIYDVQAGLHSNGMRDYDPSTGRYMQPDPLG